MDVRLDASASRRLCDQARAIGFDLCGIARAEQFDELKRFPEWLARGYAGEMNYLRDPRRRSAQGALPEARSVIVCAMNYNAQLPYSTAARVKHASTDARIGEASSADSPRGWISRYAWGGEYHDVLKDKLGQVLGWMRTEFGDEFQARPYVDTGPVIERVAAKYAGLGWLAKNTCLINQQLGSWLFLGVILTDLDFAPSLASDSLPPRNLCGSCTRCIDACPTNAIVEPYVLDARRCIAYLTIELRDPIPEEFRPSIGSMVFGCDICQDVCPWNRKAPATAAPEFQPRRIRNNTARETSTDAEKENSLFRPALEWLISLNEAEFREVFRRSPVKRAKWRGLVRNACVTIGNSSLTSANPAYSRIMHRLEALARSDDSLIAEHAKWALQQFHDDRLSAAATAEIARAKP